MVGGRHNGRGREDTMVAERHNGIGGEDIMVTGVHNGKWVAGAHNGRDYIMTRNIRCFRILTCARYVLLAQIYRL